MKKKEVTEPKFISSPLNTPMINYRVYYMSAKEKVLYTLLLFCAGGCAGLIFYGGLFKSEGEATIATYISNLVVFLLLGIIAVRVFFSTVVLSLKNKRDKALRKQFLDMMDGLVASLSSGNTIQAAFVNAKSDLLNQYSEKEHIIVELSEIIDGIHNGHTIEEMLMSFGERSNNEDIRNFSNVVENCYRMGGNFKDVIRRTRDIIGDKIAIENEIATKIASNKLQHNAMSIMPFILVGLLKLVSPMFAENLASLTGIVVTTIALGIFVGAYFWGKKIVDIK